MNVSASGFYEWFERAPTEHSQADARLTRSILESFEHIDRTHGSQPACAVDVQAVLNLIQDHRPALGGALGLVVAWSHSAGSSRLREPRLRRRWTRSF
jgi:hypothetical protein